MLYVQLDTNWPDHPKIIRAGYDGAGLHATVLCLAKRAENDGWVDRLLLTRRYGAPADLIDRLVSLDLLETDGADAVRPDGWLDRNPSQAAIDARREAKKAAGKRGNHERHHEGIPFDTCPKCNPKPQVVAPCDTDASHVGDGAIAEPRSSTQTEPQPEVTTASRPANTRMPTDVIQLGKNELASMRGRFAGSPLPQENTG